MKARQITESKLHRPIDELCRDVSVWIWQVCHLIDGNSTQLLNLSLPELFEENDLAWIHALRMTQTTQ